MRLVVVVVVVGNDIYGPTTSCWREKAATCAGPRFAIRRGPRLKHEPNPQNKPILQSPIREAIFVVRDLSLYVMKGPIRRRVPTRWQKTIANDFISVTLIKITLVLIEQSAGVFDDYTFLFALQNVYNSLTFGR